MSNPPSRRSSQLALQSHPTTPDKTSTTTSERPNTSGGGSNSPVVVPLQKENKDSPSNVNVTSKPQPIQPSSSTPNIISQPISGVSPNTNFASTNALGPIFESFVTGPALQETFPSTASQLSQDSRMMKNLITLDFTQLKV